MPRIIEAHNSGGSGVPTELPTNDPAPALADSLYGWDGVAKSFLLSDVRNLVAGGKGSDIASAGSIDIGASTGVLVDITGTTNITALGTAPAGLPRVLRFTGILTFTHNATSLILPGAANITTAASDRALMRSLGSGNWLCENYVRAATAPWNNSLTGASGLPGATGITGIIPVANLPGLQTYSGSFTRDMSLATGTQAITNVGFTPKALVCINCGTSGASGGSWSGFDNGTSRRCIEAIAGDNLSLQNTFSFIWRAVAGGANYQWGAVSSFDADGFTVDWTKVGTPTGTATVQYLAIR